MGLFDALRRKPAVAAAVVEAPLACQHSSLAPRWDSVASMGVTEAISSYHCAGCGREFSREDGDVMREDVRQAVERKRTALHHPG